MRINVRHIWQRLLKFLRFWPLPLAKKVQPQCPPPQDPFRGPNPKADAPRPAPSSCLAMAAAESLKLKPQLHSSHFLVNKTSERWIDRMSHESQLYFSFTRKMFIYQRACFCFLLIGAESKNGTRFAQKIIRVWCNLKRRL